MERFGTVLVESFNPEEFVQKVAETLDRIWFEGIKYTIHYSTTENDRHVHYSVLIVTEHS
jgi:hypothetical protein